MLNFSLSVDICSDCAVAVFKKNEQRKQENNKEKK
jgi:hypothetical protein